MNIAMIKKMGEIDAIKKQLCERYGRMVSSANGCHTGKEVQWFTESLTGVERLTAEARELVEALITLNAELAALNPPQTQPAKKAR